MNWEKFYSDEVKKLEDENSLKQEIANFISRSIERKDPIVLVTSGGTTVPLETKTVRFIDNFSVGSRGAISAEQFLENGYSVLFMARKGSLEPFQRHYQHENIFQLFHRDGGKLTVRADRESALLSHLTKYEQAVEAGRLHRLTFTTISDYLQLLRIVAEALAVCHHHAVIYLAAAVSDFFIPHDQLPENKIQSGDGALNLSLHLVPKVLQPLVSLWAPHAFTVSFKLETDESILIRKAKDALHKYHHQLVIGNVLATRKVEVVLVSGEGEKYIRLSDKQQEGVEIEAELVAAVVLSHRAFIDSHTA